MSANPYTPGEIIALLEDGRMEEHIPKAAVAIGIRHPDSKLVAIDVENGDEIGSFWPKPVLDFSRYNYRVTIPRPPNRRALRKDELPARFAVIFENSHTQTYDALWTIGEWGEHLDKLAKGEIRWSSLDGNGPDWKPFYIAEPQPPLVISTEE